MLAATQSRPNPTPLPIDATQSRRALPHAERSRGAHAQHERLVRLRSAPALDRPARARGQDTLLLERCEGGGTRSVAVEARSSARSEGSLEEGGVEVCALEALKGVNIAGVRDGGEYLLGEQKARLLLNLRRQVAQPLISKRNPWMAERGVMGASPLLCSCSCSSAVGYSNIATRRATFSRVALAL